MTQQESPFGTGTRQTHSKTMTHTNSDRTDGAQLNQTNNRSEVAR